MRKKTVVAKTSQNQYRKNPSKLNANSNTRRIPSVVDQDQTDGDSNDDLGKNLPVGEDRELQHGAGVLRKRSRKRENMFEDDCEYIDFLDREICLWCNQGGNVLVCGGKDCPVFLHEKCIDCGPKYDNLGNLYCPYCWYKLLVAEARELRKKALLAKKNLSNFLNEKLFFGSQAKHSQNVSEIRKLDRSTPKENGASTDNDNNHVGDRVQNEAIHVKKDQKNERNSSELTSEDKRRSGVEGGKQQCTTLHTADYTMMHCTENTSVCIELEQHFISTEEFNEPDELKAKPSKFAKDGDDIEEDPGNHAENENETNFGGVVKAEPLAAYYLGEDKCLHSLYSLLDGGTNGTASGNEQCMKDGGKQINGEVVVCENAFDGDSPAHYHVENLPLARRLVKHQNQKKIHHSWNQNKEFSRFGVSSHSTSEQCGKRKRLNWTVEEEDMLRAGVPKFTTANRNIPWRKILEYGRHVFDMSRTPVDLKDKWRNMVAKENPNLCD